VSWTIVSAMAAPAAGLGHPADLADRGHRDLLDAELAIEKIAYDRCAMRRAWRR